MLKYDLRSGTTRFYLATCTINIYNVSAGEYKLVAANSVGEAEREITLTVLYESCDGEEDVGSVETNGPVPVDEFGHFVADKHANGNKKFRDGYQVCFVTIL